MTATKKDLGGDAKTNVACNTPHQAEANYPWR